MLDGSVSSSYKVTFKFGLSGYLLGMFLDSPPSSPYALIILKLELSSPLIQDSKELAEARIQAYCREV